MRTSKIAIVLSFLLGGAVAAVVYSYFGLGSLTGFSLREAVRAPALSMVETTRGELTQASPVNLKDGSRYQVFNVQPDQTGLLRIQQQGALSAHMVLLTEHYEVLQDGQEGEIFYYFEDTPEHDLKLVVSGVDARSYGPFRLSTEWLDVINEGPLELDTSIQGYLKDAPNQYQFTVEAAAMYQFDMSSALFDSYLRIEGNGVSASDDDSGEGLDARLSVMLEPGEYQVTATTPYNDAQDTFATYTLMATKLNRTEDYQQGGSIEPGQQIMGFLQGDVLTYDLHLEQDTQVRIALNSDAFDAVLEVQGEDISLHDDDGGHGTNSLLSERLPAGEYTIFVRAYSPSQGEFSLQVQ